MEKTHWQEAAMKIYRIDQTLISLEQMPQEGNGTLVLLTSEELDKNPSLAGLEGILRHTPPAHPHRGDHRLRLPTHRDPGGAVRRQRSGPYHGAASGAGKAAHAA